MKTIQKIVLITILTVFQFCKSQDAKKYSNEYNKVVPKLQATAKEKKKFYDGDFSNFISEMDKKGIKIQGFFGLGKTDVSEDIYIVVLRLHTTEDFEMTIKNNYQRAMIWVRFKEHIPDEIKILTRKYEGQLSPEVREFLGNRKIEKIEFYGINGLTSKDRTIR